MSETKAFRGVLGSSGWAVDQLDSIGMREDWPRFPALKFLWLEAYSKAASEEHWDLWYGFTNDKRPYAEIQATSDDLGPFENWDDDRVVPHVAVMAIFGNSPLHQLALKFEYESHKEYYDART